MDLSRLTKQEREEWDNFVYQCRTELVEKLDSSAICMSINPGAERVDIKFAVELGLSIMLDKPIVVVSPPGVDIPDQLRKVAHTIIELEDDIDTEAGQEAFMNALKPAIASIKGE